MEIKNKTGYDLVPSEEHIISPIYNNETGVKEDKNNNKKENKKEKKGKKNRSHRKAFWVCFSNVRIRANDERKKKKEGLEEDDEFKVAKEEGFLFSNVEIEEEREKVKELVEKMRQKSCFLVCFSSVKVAV